MKNIRTLSLSSALVLFTISGGNASASCGPDAYIASVCTTAANFCPRGYSEAAGQLLAISSNTALFSLIGTQYGGDGRSTFALPDYRGRSGVGRGAGPGLQPVQQGSRSGRDLITLGIANLPAHNHAAAVSSIGNVGVSIPVAPNSGSNTMTPSSAENYLAASPGGPSGAAIWAPATSDKLVSIGGVTTSVSGTGTVTVGNAGGSQPFDSRPPQIGMRYCIAMTGIFPPRE